MHDPPPAVAVAIASIEAAWQRLAEAGTRMAAISRGYADDFEAVLAARLEAAEAEFTRCHEAIAAENARGEAGLETQLLALAARYPHALRPWADPAWVSTPLPDPPSEAIPLSGVRIGEWCHPSPVLPPISAIFALDGSPLIVSAPSDLHATARALIASVALRLVTMLPPGRVHLSLADPLGHGANLSAFLRLPAQDRTAKVLWSPDDLEQRIEVLGNELEEVIQRRLGNVYASIEEYNASVPGQAVPFRVLVLLDFPQVLSERGLARLEQLLRIGHRAGFIALIHRDPASPLPERSDPRLQQVFAPNVVIDGTGRARWSDPEFGEILLTPDALPAADRTNQLLDAVAAARERGAGSVAFDAVRVAPAAQWASSSFDGLRAPIGLTDAGEQLEFVLGHCRGQHALIGGDTQRGKTNLLHVLISQLALAYSPDELALYLLDFKGPEFLPYQNLALPHARAVALKTDPEFGLSVLKHFSEQIDARDQLFREAGVATYRDYRLRTGQPLPRAVAILDEAHVLFDGERYAGDSEPATLLEDIAKRGAGFGVHLVISTQSPASSGLRGALGPVYEQMGLRIALGTRESHVAEAILGERNTASADLSQVGEVILNDSGGRVDRNQRGRTANLQLETRESVLALIATKTGDQRRSAPASFDGARPASLLDNAAFRVYMSRPDWPTGIEIPVAWLGEPVAVSGELAAPFERYPGGNLLIAGGEIDAHGLFAATIFSLSAQLGPTELAFDFLDFARPTSKMFGMLRRLADLLPHDTAVAGQREAAATIEALTTELARRQAEEDADAPRRILVLAGTHRWRDLQDHRQNPLLKLVDEGPDWGIHTVAWVDGLIRGNPILRFFDLRASFLLTEDESSELFDNRSAASRLRPGRALYRQQDWASGRFQLFKPYPLPDEEGLSEIAARLRSKSEDHKR